MKFNQNFQLNATLLCTALVLTGCAGTADNYQPIVDGSKSHSYNSDLTACQSLSRQKSYLNGDVKTSALIGGAIGALAGAGGDSGDLLGGALVGSLTGGADEAIETRTARKNIVIQCMRQRGHAVVG